MSDITVNVTNAGAANVAVSGGSTVNATVGNGGAVNVSLGTISPGNATVVSGTLAINSVTTLAAGSQAYVKNDAGTAYAAKLDIGIPAGPATSVTVGKTTTLASGSNATVTGTADVTSLTLAFGIPRGADGAAGSNGATGATPAITASATTLSAGSSATVTATPSNGGANVALAFGIPRGADASLSDATPSALGTVSAGTSSTASRSDHVHAVPVISYANLTNVPSTFAPSTHTHSLSSLTQSSATTGQVPTWNGTAWAAATPSGGGSANIVEATTVASFPAVGSSSTLYVATDASRGYRFDASGFYVEIGPGGVRGDQVPTAPEITSLSISGTGVQVGWTASSTPATLPVLNYILQYATLTGSTLSAWTTVVRSTSAATSTSVLSLTDGSTYKFRVCGVNAVGQGPWSATSGSLAFQGMKIQYVARYATGSTPASYSTTGLGTGASPMVAYMTGGSEPGDTRLWLQVLMSGTLSYTVTASSEDGYDGGRLFSTVFGTPGQHSYGGFYDATGADIFPANPTTYASVSGAVTGTGSASGTVSVTAGQYLVLRWAKYSEGPNGGTDRVTATLSIS
jgi:hypothetical protein